MGATQTGSRRTTQKGYMENEEQGWHEVKGLGFRV